MPNQPDAFDQLPQGDLRLLDAPAAQELLASAIPARLAYVTATGAPRIVPTWFHWDGQQIVMATWVTGPHVQHRPRRLDDLTQRPDVTISIDTEDQPPVALQIRGRATIEHVDGIADEYRISAEHYLGGDAARAFFAPFENAPVSTARISVRPVWVGLLDFQTRLPGPLGGATAGAHRGD